MVCTYPVFNKLAAAARPRMCARADFDLLALVPYFDETENPLEKKIEMRIQTVCLEHAIEVATWKFVQQLPKTPYTVDEVLFLMAHGYTPAELGEADPTDH